ncbi:hypothetical protein NE235_22670 [Actinoallomurus spadix]|uniref:hypothetical protein n=1 Tax=Actinoallomurus spadix TaxID=79912 RepID=UPI0020921E9A|nr:hypothetical protein [Actinoallomurus spadix]MCO5988913.1 hypothetical protein [Actinoallomurus spadix]
MRRIEPDLLEIGLAGYRDIRVGQRAELLADIFDERLSDGGTPLAAVIHHDGRHLESFHDGPGDVLTPIRRKRCDERSDGLVHRLRERPTFRWTENPF